MNINIKTSWKIKFLSEAKDSKEKDKRSHKIVPRFLLFSCYFVSIHILYIYIIL